MFVDHASFRRLLEEAFDEYNYVRSLGYPDGVARERAINAIAPSAGSVPQTPGEVPDRPFELHIEDNGGCADSTISLAR